MSCCECDNLNTIGLDAKCWYFSSVFVANECVPWLRMWNGKWKIMMKYAFMMCGDDILFFSFPFHKTKTDFHARFERREKLLEFSKSLYNDELKSFQMKKKHFQYGKSVALTILIYFTNGSHSNHKTASYNSVVQRELSSCP